MEKIKRKKLFYRPAGKRKGGYTPTQIICGSFVILSKVRGFFLDYPYLLVFPASIVSIISISFYIMGNAFSDAADPRNHV